MERKFESVRTASSKSKEFGQRVGTDFGTMVLGYCSIPSNIWSASFRPRARPLFQLRQSAGHETTIDFHGSYHRVCHRVHLTASQFSFILEIYRRAVGTPPSALAPSRRNCRTPDTDDDPVSREVISARRKKADFLPRLIEERSTRERVNKFFLRNFRSIPLFPTSSLGLILTELFFGNFFPFFWNIRPRESKNLVSQNFKNFWIIIRCTIVELERTLNF